MVPGLTRRIPNFMVASSPRALRRLMFRNNVVKGKQFHYFDIQEMNNGKWIAFFEEVATPTELPEVKK